MINRRRFPASLACPIARAAFGALAPAMATLLAIPVLGEWPAPKDWMAILLVSGGVYLVSGAPLGSFRRGAAGVPR